MALDVSIKKQYIIPTIPGTGITYGAFGTSSSKASSTDVDTTMFLSKNTNRSGYTLDMPFVNALDVSIFRWNSDTSTLYVYGNIAAMNDVTAFASDSYLPDLWSSLKYLKEASLGAKFSWVGGLLDVCTGAGTGGSSYLSNLLDVSLVSITDKNVLLYESASGKWKNKVTQNISNLFVKNSSLNPSYFKWISGYLEPSVAGGTGDVTKAYVDGSLATLNASVGRAFFSNASLGRLSIEIVKQNASIGWLDASLRNIRATYIPNSSLNQSTFKWVGNLLEPSVAGGGTSQWTTSGSNIYYDGSVAIGTHNPSTAFHLYSSGSSTPRMMISGPNEQGLILYNDNAAGTIKTSIKFANRRDPDWTWVWGVDYSNDGRNDFWLLNRVGGGMHVIYCASNGNVILGDSTTPDYNPSAKLTVKGDVSISGSIYNKSMAAASGSNVVFYQSDGKLTYGASSASTVNVGDASISSNTTAYGTLVTFTANENFAFGDVGRITSSGRIAIAKADAIENANAIVMCAASAGISAGSSGSWLLHGTARQNTWNWTIGELIYLSVTGTTGNTVSHIIPSGANNVIQILGVASSPDTIVFNPSLVQVEHI